MRRQCAVRPLLPRADGLSCQASSTLDSDEKNIRRRVYDALNVLVAIGVLKRVRQVPLSPLCVRMSWDSGRMAK